MSRDESFLKDLMALPPSPRRLARLLRAIFAVSATIGVLAFILHWIVFFSAMRHAAAAPNGA
jgi:hypothetical protein